MKGLDYLKYYGLSIEGTNEGGEVLRYMTNYLF